MEAAGYSCPLKETSSMNRNEGKSRTRQRKWHMYKQEDWEGTQPVGEAVGLDQIIHTVNRRKISLSLD